MDKQAIPLKNELETGIFQLGLGKLNCLTCHSNFAASAGGKIIYVWDLQSGKVIGKLEGHEKEVRQIKFSPSGKLIASIEDSHIVYLWSTKECALSKKLYARALVNSVDFSAESNLLAAGTADRRVNIWQVEKGVMLDSVDGYEASFSPISNNKLAVGLRDKIELISLRKEEPNRTYHPPTPLHEIQLISFLPDGKRLLVNSVMEDFDYTRAYTVDIINLTDGKFETFDSNTASFSPDGQMLAMISKQKVLEIWNTLTKKVVKSFNISPKFSVFSSDSKRLMVNSLDSSINMLEIETGKISQTLLGHVDRVFSIAFSPAGTIIAAGGADQSIKFWDYHLCQVQNYLINLGEAIYAMTYSSDGKILAVATSSRIIKLFDTEKNSFTKTSQVLPVDRISYIAFSPDQKFIIIRSKQSITLWEPDTDEIWGNPMGTKLAGSAFSFSPDGTFLCTAEPKENTLVIWNLKAKKRIGTLPGHSRRTISLAFSPDSRTLASGSEDNTIKLWDVENGKLMHILKGHNGWISFLTFSPDSKILASDSEDHTIKLWDVENGQLLKSLEGYSGWLYSLSFSHDGKFLASALGDILFWELETLLEHV